MKQKRTIERQDKTVEQLQADYEKAAQDVRDLAKHQDEKRKSFERDQLAEMEVRRTVKREAFAAWQEALIVPAEAAKPAEPENLSLEQLPIN